MKSKYIYKGVIKESLFDELEIPLTSDLERSLGLVNGGYETLLYKVFGNKYKCLINDNIYGEDRINLDSLVPFNRLIDCGKYVTKKKVIGLYKDFLHKKLSIDLLYVGKVVFIYDYVVDDKNMTKYDMVYHGTLTDINLKCKLVKEAILYKLDNNTFLDLESYVKYKNTNLGLGQLTVIDCEPFLVNDIDQNREIEQIKILKKFRKDLY